MIIFRYLSRQVLTGMLAVSGILLLVFMSGRFIKYLSQAAAGEISGAVLFSLMYYRLPDFLVLILPLGLFIGMLLAYGRMYMESEMTVLFACGYSERRLLAHSLTTSMVVAILVAVMSLWLSPAGLENVQNIFREQSKVTEFELLTPGRFQALKSGTRVTYVESLSDDRRVLNNPLIAETDKEGRVVVTVATSGHQSVNPESGSRFLVLDHGYRFAGVPGDLDYEVTEFSRYGLKLAEGSGGYVKTFDDAAPTSALWGSTNPKEIATLHWRLSLPLLVPVVTLLAVRLSRVNPRQGRFAHLLPAMLLYVLYLGLLIGARSAVAKGRLPPWAGSWMVHVMFLSVAAGLFMWPAWQRQRRAKHAQA